MILSGLILLAWTGFVFLGWVKVYRGRNWARDTMHSGVNFAMFFQVIGLIVLAVFHYRDTYGNVNLIYWIALALGPVMMVLFKLLINKTPKDIFHNRMPYKVLTHLIAWVWILATVWLLAQTAEDLLPYVIYKFLKPVL
ncbi:MAG: hypothetical protein ABIB97_01760 [Patescibacteria group bacterium]